MPIYFNGFCLWEFIHFQSTPMLFDCQLIFEMDLKEFLFEGSKGSFANYDTQKNDFLTPPFPPFKEQQILYLDYQKFFNLPYPLKRDVICERPQRSHQKIEFLGTFSILKQSLLSEFGI